MTLFVKQPEQYDWFNFDGTNDTNLINYLGGSSNVWLLDNESAPFRVALVALNSSTYITLILPSNGWVRSNPNTTGPNDLYEVITDDGGKPAGYAPYEDVYVTP